MTYQAPVDDIMRALKTAAGLDGLISSGVYEGLDEDTVRAVIEEAGKFGAEVLDPLNWTGDRTGSKLENGAVSTPPGWKEAYRQFASGGWSALPCPEEFGGQGLPGVLSMAACEIWNASNLSFGLCPLLTQGAIDALHTDGSDELKATYLPKMISGEWTGTMNLTEPQAGSDLGAIRTKAVRQADGTYRIFGTKIFITYGDHELTDNIVHMVLARLPDAPAGTRGISLFLVPKRLVNADGSLGARNDVVCAGLEHKLGIHASPTCVMKFGEGDGAVGYLVGHENRGLNTMFIMMNAARLAVGIQGVAVAERATQRAVAYARDRRQGRTQSSKGGEMGPIIEHADIRRTILTMKALTQAARSICLVTAREIDVSHRAKDAAQRKAAADKAALLTPIAKAFSTDIGCEVASMGVQIHGGMGFVEETGPFGVDGVTVAALLSDGGGEGEHHPGGDGVVAPLEARLSGQEVAEHAAHVLFHHLPDRPAVGVPEHHAWRVFLGVKQVLMLADFAVVAAAGVFEAPFWRYTALTAVGSALWAFGFAGAGWAAGSAACRWRSRCARSSAETTASR